jgi:hypothetical protein
LTSPVPSAGPSDAPERVASVEAPAANGTPSGTGGHRRLLAGRSWLVAVAALVAAVELVMAVTRTPFYARVGNKNLHAPKLLVRDADVDAFVYYDPTFAMVAAQYAIPRNATYTIVVGNEGKHAMVPGLAIDVYRLFLMPRKYTTDIKKAQWALTYWKSSEFLGVPYTTELGLGPGVNAVKLSTGVRR